MLKLGSKWLCHRGTAKGVRGCLIYGFVLALTATAQASVQTTLYVSPSGSGTTCTQSVPCSLATAQSTAEGLTTSMTGDIVVQLQGGTYPLSSTWTFTSADSGKNGFDVIYQAAPGQAVVVSGGQSITGWTLYNEGLNIYSASVPVGFDTRQLYVNGQRASVDHESTSVAFGTMTQTAGGYTYTGTAPNSWTETNRLVFVYSNTGQSYTWAYSMCSPSSIANGTITMATPCWTNGVYLGFGIPGEVQNNLALLTTPGQFYVDPTAGVIYYIPLPGQDLSTAIAGGLQSLLSANGTSTSPVQNLQFQGITFSYAGWLFGSEGEVDLQADVTLVDDETLSMVPAAVTCHLCKSVSFIGDTFTHLGGSGLSFDSGGQNNSAIGNIVTDVSGNGISSGFDADGTTIENGDTISDNYVYNVSNEYLGGIGIFGLHVDNAVIDSNEVWGTPYTGISLGWGWGRGSYLGMVNNQINNNYVHDVMTSSLFDGGSIYVNGTEGNSPAPTIQGNYVSQDPQIYGALYLDGGSTYWQVTNNVVDGYSPYWLLVQPGGQISQYNTVQDNYVGSQGGTIYGTPPSDNTISDNTTGLTSWPSAAQSIINASGLQGTYVGLRGPAISNLAYLTPVYVSSSESSENNGPKANSGALNSPWVSATADTSAYWQTDLGASYTLNNIQILFRQDGTDQPTERENFQVWLSNTGSLSSGYTVACVQGATPLAYESQYNCPAPAGSWRYVSVVKSDGNQEVLGQVRVFGGDTNVALGQEAVASSVYMGAYPASNAVDGSTSTIFGDNTGPQGWWQVDLPRQYTTSLAQVVFRSDAVDNPLEREDFQIWVSNNSNMGITHTVACTVGNTPLPFASTYNCALPAGPWQYVAVVKSDSNELVLAEVRVFGH